MKTAAAIATALVLAAGSAGAAPAAAGPPLAVVGADGASHTLLAADIAALPAAQASLPGGAHPTLCDGPLLWSVLDFAHAIDASTPKAIVRQEVVVTGRDGYQVVLAGGELAPALENKRVILADRIDGKALPLNEYRLVVPGDQHAARSVHDVVRVAVVELSTSR